MNASMRKFLKWSLLGVVALSLLAVVRGADPAKAPPAAPPAVAGGPVTVAVYYFHGFARCATCRKLEEYSHAAVTGGFADEVRKGQMTFSAVNVEEAENAHFVRDYKLSSKTVVIQKMSRGKRLEWRNLDRSWELVGNREKFLDYMRGEISSLKGSGA